MFVSKIWTQHQECILKITVKSTIPQMLRFVVLDPSQKNTVLIDKVQNVKSEYSYYARCPLIGEYTEIRVYSDDGYDDSSFKLFPIETLELEKKIDSVDMGFNLMSFVRFAQKFAYNAGILTPNVYQSNSGLFYIRYLDEIKDYETGEVLDTPFRISMADGLIEANRKLILSYTVPMRFMLLCHEYCHFFVNHDGDNELEADLNGLTIYLGLGYPRYEAQIAYGETFKHNETEENDHRWETIKKFIDEYESKNYLFNENTN